MFDAETRIVEFGAGAVDKPFDKFEDQAQEFCDLFLRSEDADESSELNFDG